MLLESTDVVVGVAFVQIPIHFTLDDVHVVHNKDSTDNDAYDDTVKVGHKSKKPSAIGLLRFGRDSNPRPPA